MFKYAFFVKLSIIYSAVQKSAIFNNFKKVIYYTN